MEKKESVKEIVINPDGAVKRGYLNEGVRVFYLDSVEKEKISPHYHEFHKVILFLGGQLSYIVEGKNYHMDPGDALLIPAGCIHQPVIDPGISYRRYVLWLSVQAAESLGAARYFEKPWKTGSTEKESDVDPVVSDVIRYINAHLQDDLSLENLCDRFLLSKSSLTARFRKITGFTPHQYILEKRVNHARELMDTGVNANEAAERCGFTEYSTFYRVYRKTFGEGPGRR